MSNIDAYMKKKFLLEQIQREVEELEADEQLQKDLAFREELEKLLEQHGKTTQDISRILNLHGEESEQANDEGRRNYHRRTKLFKNPHTGEEIETRGGNNKKLVAWREQYGAEEVNKWGKVID